MECIVTRNTDTDELMHYGVKGMKWGVRRYQNKDGSLTDKGKKKVSREYEKYTKKGVSDVAKTYNSRYIKAYNKAANDMNDGMIDKYNKDYAKKLGSKAKNHDYYNDDEYTRGYEAMFTKQFNKHMNELTLSEIKRNKNYKKAQELCDRYNMESFDELARKNSEAIRNFLK